MGYRREGGKGGREREGEGERGVERKGKRREGRGRSVHGLTANVSRASMRVRENLQCTQSHKLIELSICSILYMYIHCMATYAPH